MSDLTPLSADKILDLWMHQNSLAWSRFKIAAALQGGVFAGWYYAMYDDLPEVALPLAFFGAALVAILACLALGDLKGRNECREKLHPPGAASAPLFENLRPDRFVLSLVFVALFAGSGALAWASWRYPDFMAAPADDAGSGASNRVVAMDAPRPLDPA